MKKTRFSSHDKCLLFIVKDFQKFNSNTINIFNEIKNDFRSKCLLMNCKSLSNDK